jgi:hypothetical protein
VPKNFNLKNLKGTLHSADLAVHGRTGLIFSCLLELHSSWPTCCFWTPSNVLCSLRVKGIQQMLTSSHPISAHVITLPLNENPNGKWDQHFQHVHFWLTSQVPNASVSTNFPVNCPVIVLSALLACLWIRRPNVDYRHTRPGALNWPLSEQGDWRVSNVLKTIRNMFFFSSVCGIKITIL